MSGLELPPLYHWSPERRRRNIRARGLLPGRAPVVSTSTQVDSFGLDDPPRPVLCLATDPLWAWNLSGGANWLQDGRWWDLWQVWLADTDEVHVRPDFGPRIIEVRVANPIPKSRVRHVASRSADSHRW